MNSGNYRSDLNNLNNTDMKIRIEKFKEELKKKKIIGIYFWGKNLKLTENLSFTLNDPSVFVTREN